MIVFGGLFVLSFGIGILQIFLKSIPVVGWMFSLTLGLVSMFIAPIGFVIWLVLIIKAYKGDQYKLPIAGSMAEDYV